MSTVAWIGLGNMGLPMASHLVAAGHAVRGVDIDPDNAAKATQAGIRMVDSVAGAVRGADVVFTMLPSGKHVASICGGPDGVFALARDAVVVDCSTIDIATAKALNAEADEQGVAFIDAPVSGGVGGATRGSLTIMVGGRAEHFARAEPFLRQMGGYVVHVGAGTAGQAMKIVNNMMFGIGLAAACEGSVLAQRLGLDGKTFYDVVTRSSGDNWAFRTWCPIPDVVATAPSSHGYTPGFTTELLVKDLTLAVAAGAAVNAPLAAAHSALQLFSDNVAAGAAGRDCTSLVIELDRIAEAGQPTTDHPGR